MSNTMKFVFLLSLVAADVLADRSEDHDDRPKQGGKSLFFLGGLFRRIRSRWQNHHLPPSPYGSQPVFAGYYGCGFYNYCPPPQPVQVLQAIQPIQPVPTIVQTPIVVQQAQVFQPSTYAQSVSQQNQDPAQAQPQTPLYQYPALPPYGSSQPVYGGPQPGYGNYQPYQPPYPMYSTAYASAIPGQFYQNTGCGFTGYICGRRS